MASCGEYGGRNCGINGSYCRTRQNSHELLLERLGAGTEAPVGNDENESEDELASGVIGGCNAGRGAGNGTGLLLLLAALGRLHRRRS
jgi:hypothetical protein